MNNTLDQILQEFSPVESAPLDLDRLREKLTELSAEISDVTARMNFYEAALQRDLRAKVDLCGPVTACPTPETAFSLHGEILMEARREASRRFNQIFMMAPICRR